MPRIDGVAYTFTGHPEDAFVNGIPARDLTEADLATMTDEQRAAVAGSPLYAAPSKVMARGAYPTVAADAVPAPAAEAPKASEKK